MVDLAAPVQELKLLQLNKYNQEDKNRLLSFLEEGERVGLLSEAGLPCVADPGGAVVRLAAEHGFTIKPLVGPSSLMLAWPGDRSPLGLCPVAAMDRDLLFVATYLSLPKRGRRHLWI